MLQGNIHSKIIYKNLALSSQCLLYLGKLIMLKKILMKLIGINEYTKPIKTTYKNNNGNIIHLENLQPYKTTPE